MFLALTVRLYYEHAISAANSKSYNQASNHTILCVILLLFMDFNIQDCDLHKNIFKVLYLQENDYRAFDFPHSHSICRTRLDQ